MEFFNTRDALQTALDMRRLTGQRIGLVPTMGNLHEGHLALVDEARKRCGYVLATIFINPLQFGPGEDLANYPRTLEEDLEKLASRGCDAVFVPPDHEMYPNGLDNLTLVTVPGLSERHCGKSRPGHFSGVCTVVSKLFNLTQPDAAFFGEKDYQQLQIIRKMAGDLCFPLDIIGVPTVRLPSGLAMSSRNGYLDESQLLKAATLYQCLQIAADRMQQGDRQYGKIEQAACSRLEQAGFIVDYFNISHADTLEPATDSDRQLVILAAARLGPTRLIDNIRCSLPVASVSIATGME